MIFVTVGSQMPFDRMVGGVDRWAAARGRRDVLAQVGDTESPPAHVEWVRGLPRAEYDQRFREADLVVGHAGTGTLFTALELGVPLIVMARIAAQRETRNEHQTATAERFVERGLCAFARDEDELHDLLDHPDRVPRPACIGPHAAGPLVDRLRTFFSETLG